MTTRCLRTSRPSVRNSTPGLRRHWRSSTAPAGSCWRCVHTCAALLTWPSAGAGPRTRSRRSRAPRGTRPAAGDRPRPEGIRRCQPRLRVVREFRGAQPRRTDRALEQQRFGHGSGGSHPRGRAGPGCVARVSCGSAGASPAWHSSRSCPDTGRCRRRRSRHPACRCTARCERSTSRCIRAGGSSPARARPASRRIGWRRDGQRNSMQPCVRRATDSSARRPLRRRRGTTPTCLQR